MIRQKDFSVTADAGQVKFHFKSYLTGEPAFTVSPGLRNILNVYKDTIASQYAALQKLADDAQAHIDTMRALGHLGPAPATVNFMDYFDDVVEYPRDILTKPFPLNVLYDYVADSLLDGILSQVYPVKAYVVNRYTGWNDPLPDKETISVYDEGALVKLEVTTKLQAYTALCKQTQCRRLFLSDFQDDVLLLARTSDDSECNTWVYFWFDCDSSDCGIGRFQTDDLYPDVVAAFTRFATNCPVSAMYGVTQDSREIPALLLDRSIMSWR